MGRPQHVYLVPGFFGFVNFGRLVYFAHVNEVLAAALARRGVRPEIHRTSVSPTASLPHRAATLARFIAETAEDDADIHLVGHSTGGLDARLLATPGASLPDVDDPEPIARRIRSITSVSTPHRGVPLATVFTGLVGPQLLRVLSLVTVTVLREGRLPAKLAVKLMSAVAGLQFAGSRVEALLAHLEQELVQQLPEADQPSVLEFLEHLSDDQSLILQLTREGLELFNASTMNREGVAYGSVVSRASRPKHRHRFALGLSPVDQLMYTAFQALFAISARFPPNAVDAIDEGLRRKLERAFGGKPVPAGANDGIVPSWSQPWGDVIYAARGDHLDFIGHFDDEDHRPPHHDWLPSHSGFDRARFEAVWVAVADFIADAVPA